ncbi:hypothetical protein GGI01_003622 [Coemansia sp. RSA 376]|nr:hypothetical protein GGI01_003622 [Coemansia sp. RSA 376]
MSTDSIYCLAKNCIQSPDWLTYMPSPAVGWAVGGIAVLIAAMSIIPTFYKGEVRLTHGTDAFYLLALSLFLRSVLNYKVVNTAAAYKASLFFNYYTAICLHEQVVSSIFRYTIKLNWRISGLAEQFKIPFSAVHLIQFVMMIPAVAVMFDVVNANGVDPSVYLIRTVVFSTMVMSLVVIVKAMAIDIRKQNCNLRALLVSVLPRNLLFIMWGCYMASRTFLPLDSVARDSEVAFYMLNVFLLILAGVAHESVSGLVVFEPEQDDTTFKPDHSSGRLHGQWAGTHCSDVLSDFYSNTMTTHTESTHQVHSDDDHKPCNYPFHCKLRLSAYINQQQADARLKRNMIQKFGKRQILLCTSKTCPGCDGDLHKRKVIDNTRPYRRWQRRLTFCHGLLQCSNCLVKQLDDERNVVYKPRLYNRNLAATLNFRRIIQYFIRKGDIPPVFKRPTRVVAAMPTPMSTAARGRGAPRAVVADTVAPERTFLMTLRSAHRSDLASDVQPLSKRPRRG